MFPPRCLVPRWLRDLARQKTAQRDFEASIESEGLPEPNSADKRAMMPHCDQRILHAPGECQYCDAYPDWQNLRVFWGVDFTGHETDGNVPCPADYQRGNSHQLWGGNRPKPREDQ
jgi:hypothetical protein